MRSMFEVVGGACVCFMLLAAGLVALIRCLVEAHFDSGVRRYCDDKFYGGEG